MSLSCAVTALVENSVYQLELLAEHGDAFLVQAGGMRVLFDTGQGKVLLKNAAALGISLEGLDAVVISHGHCDHTGGLAEVLSLPGAPAVYVGQHRRQGVQVGVNVAQAPRPSMCTPKP